MRFGIFIFPIIVQSVHTAVVSKLPGEPPNNFSLYAGYFDVVDDQHLHYIFVKSDVDPTTKPTIAWLSNSFGCSTLFSFFSTFGPYLVGTDGETLYLNEHTWSKEANILIIDSPSGVGFSYGANYTYNYDEISNIHFEALKAFRTTFPEHAAADLYIGGSSTAGYLAPMLANKIIKQQLDFNLKGLVLHSADINWVQSFISRFIFMYNHGLIDEGKFNDFKMFCCYGNFDDCTYDTFANPTFCSDLIFNITYDIWLSGINPFNINADCISRDGSAFMCLNKKPIIQYLQQQNVRSALGVSKNVSNWEVCSASFDDYEEGEPFPEVFNATISGMQILFINGDADLSNDFLMTQKYVDRLGVELLNEKKAFIVDGQVAGHYTQYRNIGIGIIKGGDHMSSNKKKQTLHLLRAFLNKEHP